MYYLCMFAKQDPAKYNADSVMVCLLMLILEQCAVKLCHTEPSQSLSVQFKILLTGIVAFSICILYVLIS